MEQEQREEKEERVIYDSYRDFCIKTGNSFKSSPQERRKHITLLKKKYLFVREGHKFIVLKTLDTKVPTSRVKGFCSMTYEEALECLLYEPVKGLFYDKRTGERIQGYTSKKGYLIMNIGRSSKSMAKIACHLKTGVLPEGQVTYLDNNPSNLSWSNLIML